MVAFSGRIEAKFTVPASTTISVSSGALTSAVSVTLPAASYYHTAAGGVSSGIDALEAAINAAVGAAPDNAASLASVIGGTWSAGYLCQEASGALVAAFGGNNLSAVSSPAYQLAGPGQGTDYAVGFDSADDAFSGGNIYDVGATDDVIGALVVYFDSVAGNEDVWGKDTGTGYLLVREGSSLTWYTRDGVDEVKPSVAITAGAWYAVVVALDRTNSLSRIAVAPISTAVATASAATSTTAIGSLSNASDFLLGDNDSYGAGNMRVSCLYVGVGSGVAGSIVANIATAVSAFASAISSSFSVALSTTDGRVTIANSYYSYSLTWTSTTLRDLLGFDANITSQTTATGAKQAKALWLPDSPLNSDSHPSMYPDETDTRGSESPTGVVLGLSGNVKYVHENVRYDRVPVDRIRESSATYANASLETFFRDCISGMGHSWFKPLSPMQFYWSNAGTDTLLGADAGGGTGTAGWSPVGISKFKDIAVPSQVGWTGQFNVRFARLVSNG